MAKAFVICQNCQEIFIRDEVKEHRKKTGHSDWTLCYRVLPMRTLWIWVIMSRTEYQQLVQENKLLREKIVKQAEIIAEAKNREMRNVRLGK